MAGKSPRRNPLHFTRKNIVGQLFATGGEIKNNTIKKNVLKKCENGVLR